MEGLSDPCASMQHCGDEGKQAFVIVAYLLQISSSRKLLKAAKPSVSDHALRTSVALQNSIQITLRHPESQKLSGIDRRIPRHKWGGGVPGGSAHTEPLQLLACSCDALQARVTEARAAGHGQLLKERSL